MSLFMLTAVALWTLLFVRSQRLQRAADYQVGAIILLAMTAFVLMLAGGL